MNNYQHILIAVDFSDISEHAAQRAVELARFYGARATFMHVIENFPEHLPHYKMSREEMDPEEFLINQAGEDLRKLCTKLKVDDAEQVVKLTKHSAKGEVVEFARQNQVDLIVLGSQGRNRLAEFIAGSTATGIVRAAVCDVFAVRGDT